MKRRTLVGRLSAVQTTVTLLTLAVVTAGTSVAVKTLFTRKTDEALKETAGRVGWLVAHTPPETLEREWVEAEIQEVRPSHMRVEVQDAQGHVRATAGDALDLSGSVVGCADRTPIRVCGVGAGPFLVLTAVDRSADIAAQNRLLFALTAIAAIAGALVTLMSRVITRRALRPLSELAARVTVLSPGAGQRIALHCDLAELELLETRFDELVARFDEALARERRFAAQASHELRTPLTVARAEIENLAASGEAAGGPERALAAVDRLSELVEALLWFARAQGRLDDDRMELVNLADLLRAQLAARSNGSAVLRLPDEVLVRGDEHLLGRITENLVDNALKYGGAAPIEVTAALDGSRVRVKVVDRGGGLPAEMHERIFEPFFRGHPGRPDVQGFGLGLSFARAVARAHGGDVVLEAASAQRTEFVLILPVIAWSEEANAAERADASVRFESSPPFGSR